MENVELIIKIPKETYKDIIENGFIYDEDNEYIAKAIKNGTPLPKGHGRLIDADAYAKKFDTNINGRIGEEYIFAPTIIETDKESEGQK